jgi:hypothetical protein
MLPPAQSQALKKEIQDDPEHLGYAGKSPSQVADLLNEKRFTRNYPIPLKKVLIWGAKTGALGKLDAAAKDTQNPLQSVAMAALRVLDGSVSDSLDLSDPDVMALIGALTQAGIFSAQSVQALSQIQAIPASRAEILGISVDHLDVSSSLS